MCTSDQMYIVVERSDDEGGSSSTCTVEGCDGDEDGTDWFAVDDLGPCHSGALAWPPGGQPGDAFSFWGLGKGPSQQQPFVHSRNGRRVFECRSQLCYQHGSQMCTTACMQVCIAVLCSKLDLLRAELAPWTKELRDAVHENLNWCMEAGNVVHGRVEGMLNTRQHSTASVPGSGGRHFMLSVNDIVKILGINLSALHIGMDELLVSLKGCSTGMKQRPVASPKDGQKGCCMLKYEPVSCYISLSHLPACMELQVQPHQGPSAQRVSTSIITANGHSVCCACYYPSGGEIPSYSFFDPLPGTMCVGLSGSQMVTMVKDAIRIPSGVCWGSKPFPLVRGVNKRHRKAERSKKGSHEIDGEGSSSHGGRGMELDSFYADVTTLHILES